MAENYAVNDSKSIEKASSKKKLKKNLGNTNQFLSPIDSKNYVMPYIDSKPSALQASSSLRK